MNGELKIDLIKAFMQFSGNVRITSTTYNYDRDRGIKFSGYYMDDSKKTVNVTMDKHQIESVMECNTIQELHECYTEMEYF